MLLFFWFQQFVFVKNLKAGFGPNGSNCHLLPPLNIVFHSTKVKSDQSFLVFGELWHSAILFVKKVENWVWILAQVNFGQKFLGKLMLIQFEFESPSGTSLGDCTSRQLHFRVVLVKIAAGACTFNFTLNPELVLKINLFISSYIFRRWGKITICTFFFR